MIRLGVFASVVIATLAFAAYSGWSSYSARPEGMLLYTPIGPCPAMHHSFTLTYRLCLAAASTIAVVLSIVAFGVSTMQRFSAAKLRLRSTSKLCLVAIAIFFGASFLSPLFEKQFPLHIKPGCQRNAP